MRLSALTILAALVLGLAACASQGATSKTEDAAQEASPAVDATRSVEARVDARATHAVDATEPEAARDSGEEEAPPLVRLANGSPDAPEIDLCLAERGSGVWVGPLLGARAGVSFPAVSAYIAITPALDDVRIVTSGTDCTVPLFPDVTDLPAFVPGTHATLATVGDLDPEGSDPAIKLALFADDAAITPGAVRLRFINAVPSATDVSLVVERAGVLTPLIAASFGDVGVDTDAGALDSDDYLAVPPVAGATWFAIDYRGTGPVLASAYGVNVGQGTLATVVAVGGESGPDAPDVGLLLCIDTPPIVAGELAVCSLVGGSID